MGAFAIVPRESIEELPRLADGFRRRGFTDQVLWDFPAFSLLYCAKFNGVQQFFQHQNGSVIFTVGSLWYRNRPFAKVKELLLRDFEQGSLELSELSGVFCLIFADRLRNRATIVHDPQATYRLYLDLSSGVLSSSWLTLAWLRGESCDIRYQAVLENLVMGFNLGEKTWIKGIDRVKASASLPKCFSYRRLTEGLADQTPYTDFSLAVADSTEVLRNSLVKKFDPSTKIVMGLSSGFDSRLTASVIEQEGYPGLSYFTFYKPGDMDLEIAHQIARAVGRKLKVIETVRLEEEESQKEVFSDAFEFFDGQCAIMMQYSKKDYTRTFREELLAGTEVHLSGVGGELFRNYCHDHKWDLPLKFWIEHYFAGGALFDWFRNPSKLLQGVQEELRSGLSIESSSVSYFQRKRFYAQIFLSDWHGVRNSVENQYSHYYTPFVDLSVIRQSLRTTAMHGVGGEFEAAMIKSLSPVLAGFQSEYGHDFVKIPTSHMVRQYVRAILKAPVFSVFRRSVIRRRHVPRFTQFEAGLIDQMQSMLRLEGYDVDLRKLAAQRKEQVLVAAYVLARIKGVL